MKIILDEVTSVKISPIRLSQLQKGFNKNYNNIARSIFHNLNPDLQLSLLNDEFHFDKQIVVLTGHHSKGLISRRIKESRIPYLYTPYFTQLKDNNNAQIHLRHNAYRTISALLLDDCSFEEKVIILSKSINAMRFKNRDILNIASFRLNTLIDRLNEHSYDIKH